MNNNKNIFKINYDMTGGANDYKLMAPNLNIFPNYPNNLGAVRSSDSWPPKKNTHIIIQDKIYGQLPGTVISNIWNKTAAIVRLDNQNHPIPEASLVNESNYNNGKGHYLLLADHYWTYDGGVQANNKSVKFTQDPYARVISPNTIIPTNQSVTDPQNDSPNFTSNMSPAPPMSTSIPNELSNDTLLTNAQMNAASIRTNNVNNLEVKDQMDQSNIAVDMNHFKSEHTNNLVMHMKEGSFMPSDHTGITNNPIYAPLLTGSKKDYFSEKEIDIVLSNTGKSLKSLSKDKVKLLKDKLQHFEKISDNDIFLVLNKNLAINQLISNPEDEINEGNKIKIWIEKILQKNLFQDLDVKIHQGYVYVTRVGVKVYDKVSKDLVPNLKFFKWQYDKPIDYHTLKYVIFQNSFQKNIQTNIIQKREAESILAQEYVIALQPNPYYSLWTLKRLIMLWYADEKIEQNIRKIKILINQFRADPVQEYNKKNGILPQILIYPKYGAESARIVLSKIDYYFSLYIDEKIAKSSQLIWKNSKPSHFISKNNFIFYSNGSIDLKNYIKDSLNENSGFVNDVFNKDYTELLDSKSVMSI